MLLAHVLARLRPASPKIGSRPVVLKRYGGASFVRVRCPRRRVHVSTNTNGGASVLTCRAWRSVAAWRVVWRVRCPVPLSRPQQRKTAKTGTAARPVARGVHVVRNTTTTAFSRGALCPVSSTGTAAALCPQQEQRQQRRRRNEPATTAFSWRCFASVALSRGAIPL